MEHHSTEIVPPRLPSSQEHIKVMPGHCGGKAHIAGHRVKVQHVAAWHEQLGRSPDEIVAEHPGLTLADVYAALAYYYDHRDEIDADMQADVEFVAALTQAHSLGEIIRLLGLIWELLEPGEIRSRVEFL